MNSECKHQSNGFSNGFILGGILGAGAVFLFGTEKGRKLLKKMTSEGVENLSEMGDSLFEKYLDDDYDDVLADEFPEDEGASPRKTAQTLKKRLFRGVKRDSK